MNLAMRNDNSQDEDFGEAITGVHSAIKQFVEAKKENTDDTKTSVKKGILKKAVDKSK